MKSPLLLAAMALALSACTTSARECRAYEAVLENLREVSRKPEDLDRALGPYPKGKMPKMGKSWRYLKLEGIYLPLPEAPKEATKDELGNLVLKSPRFRAVIGKETVQAILDGEGRMARYLAALKIASDYDLYLYLHGKKLLECEGLVERGDAGLRVMLATIKISEMPFLHSLAMHSPENGALVFSGPARASHEFVTNLILKRDEKSAYNLMLYFPTAEMQRQFHRMVPFIREPKWFDPKKAVKL